MACEPRRSSGAPRQAAFAAPDAAATSGVQWKDLLQLGRGQVAGELLLSLPWLLASWLLAGSGRYVAALACSFMFFLTGLRQAHNAFHGSLGLSRAATDGVMAALSMLMLGSMHAVQVNHLRHHRYCMGSEDVEAMSARMPAWRAVLFGPLFPLLLHRKAMQVGNRRQRLWIMAELALNVVAVALVFAVLGQPWLKYHVLAMASGQCLTAFFAVWTVHRGCESTGAIARTMRGKVFAWATYSMFFHLEHHRFPRVPTCRLGVLASRLDTLAPGGPTLRVI